jgi:hypothetical protein
VDDQKSKVQFSAWARECISEFLFLNPEDIKIYVWGPSGTSARNRALLSCYQIMGHNRPKA